MSITYPIVLIFNRQIIYKKATLQALLDFEITV